MTLLTHIILVLAHEGLSQPTVWKHFLTTAEDNMNVELFIYNVQKDSLKTQFERDHHLDIGELPFCMWGNEGLVEVQLMAMKAILDEYAEFVIHHVSGDTIPFAPAKHLLRRVDTTFCSPRRNSYRMWKYRNRSSLADAVDEKDIHDLYMTNNDGEENGVSTSQWSTITSSDASFLVTKLLDEHLYDKLSKKFRRDCRQTKSLVGCPDEFFLVSTLEHFLDRGLSTNQSKTIENCLVTFVKSDFYSPIKFTSMDEFESTEPFKLKRTVFLGKQGRNNDKCITTTLRNILCYLRLQGHAVFFRKVGNQFDASEVNTLISADSKREVMDCSFFPQNMKSCVDEKSMLYHMECLARLSKFEGKYLDDTGIKTYAYTDDVDVNSLPFRGALCKTSGFFGNPREKPLFNYMTNYEDCFSEEDILDDSEIDNEPFVRETDCNVT
jgi:hypothetical protein